jgi:hypothetical protein
MKRSVMSYVGLTIAAVLASAGLFIIAFMILAALGSIKLFPNK